MAKIEVARWLTPGLSVRRLVFVSYGGSAHGVVRVERQDPDTGEWSTVEAECSECGHEYAGFGEANGPPEPIGKRVNDEHVNQFTGGTVTDR